MASEEISQKDFGNTILECPRIILMFLTIFVIKSSRESEFFRKKDYQMKFGVLE